jgi:hypothetical protein
VLHRHLHAGFHHLELIRKRNGRQVQHSHTESWTAGRRASWPTASPAAGVLLLALCEQQACVAAAHGPGGIPA